MPPTALLRRLLPALAGFAITLPALAASEPPSAPVLPKADFGKAAHSADTGRLADWIVRTRDNKGAPFALIDKRGARVFVFDAGGHLRGDAPVLLGLAHGDRTVPGIGDKPLAQIKDWERTTPAGRFVGEHGDNAHGVHVIWIDYDAAVSMHPVITNNPKEHRLERLQTPTVADNRISYGCVNVPIAFFHEVVEKTLAAEHPVIYVLPDMHPAASVFAGLSGARTSTPVHTALARK